VDDFYNRALSPQDVASLWNKTAPQGATPYSALDLTGSARLTGNLSLVQPPGRVNPDVSLRLHGVRASTAAAGSVQSGILLGATDAGATPGTSLKGGLY
jgi:hypothetical protein